MASETSIRQTPLDRRGRLTFYALEGIGSLASSYYFNYLFFYLRDHFDFGNRGNLLIAGFEGLLYMVFAFLAGRFIQRVGPMAALRLGFCGMGVGMLAGAVAPRFLGYGKALEAVEWGIVLLWTVSMCQTWPALQRLLGRGQTRPELSRTAAFYNLTWSSATALAYLTSGALLEHFGGEILFWIPALLHGVQLIVLGAEERRQGRLASATAVPQASEEEAEADPRADAAQIARGRNFLHLAWVANPFAYVAIYALLPVIPRLADAFALSPETAGFFCCIWMWARMLSFLLFFLWPGWQYRFRFLLMAFIAVAAGFLAALLVAHLWMLVVAQVVFGLSIGLIYSSSLFYSMDLGVSGGKGGGIHEAAIGLGMFMGPCAGVVALRFFPGHPGASTWGTGGLLLAGLGIFLRVRASRPKAAI